MNHLDTNPEPEQETQTADAANKPRPGTINLPVNFPRHKTPQRNQELAPQLPAARPPVSHKKALINQVAEHRTWQKKVFLC
jgi:hypothetical protein